MKYREAKKTVLSARRTAIVTVAVSVAALMAACSAKYSVSLEEPMSYEFQKTVGDAISSSVEESVEEIFSAENDAPVLEEFPSVFEDAALQIEEDVPGVSVQFEVADVVRVVDGDTLVVHIDGQNNDVKVRLIGVDTPESVAPKEYLERTGKENSREGAIASDFTKALLPVGTTVYLEKDVSDIDRYGRALRYVWLDLPQNTSNADEIREKMLQGQLLSMGIAVPATYAPDTKNAEVFATISHKAQEENLEDVFGSFDKEEEEY